MPYAKDNREPYDSTKFKQAPEKYAEPEGDVSLYYNWTIPKSKHTSESNREDGFHEPITQDLPTSFLSPKKEEIVLDYLSLSANLLEFSNQTGYKLTGAQRHITRIISNYVNTSKGENGNLLKVIRTSWQVTEERKADITEKEEPTETQRKRPFTMLLPNTNRQN